MNFEKTKKDKKKSYCSAYDENDKTGACQQCAGKNESFDWDNYHFTRYLCFRY